MRTLERQFPIPIRIFLFAVIGPLSVAAVGVVAASVLNDEPPLWFAILYLAALIWNVNWWAWRSPIPVDVDAIGTLTFASALGRRISVPNGAVRSVTLSLLMVPVVRYDGGRIWLLPTAPTQELVAYLEAECPDVDIELPNWAVPGTARQRPR